MSEGASYTEQILDACRRNNDLLLQQIFEELETPKAIADAINKAVDPTGNTAIHLAVHYGNYQALDVILDQEGIDIDPRNRSDGDTPLHLAVKYTYDDFDYGKFLVEQLVDVGADPRIKNKHGDRPIDLIRDSSEEAQNLKYFLEESEYTLMLERTNTHHHGKEIADKLQGLNVSTTTDGAQQQLQDENDEGSGSESPSDDDEEIPPPPVAKD